MDIFKNIDLERDTLELKDFLEIQNNLQTLTTNNVYWTSQLTPSMVNCAILSEINELQDCFPWAWWKVGSYDEWNSILEVVDIFHFWLVRNILINTIHEKRSIRFDNNFKERFYVNDKFDHKYFITITKNVQTSYNLDNMTTLMQCVGIDLELLSAVYVAKATLNSIRVKGGYKEGKYIKNKDGVEDNYHLKEVISIFSNHSKYHLNDVRKSVIKRFC